MLLLSSLIACSGGKSQAELPVEPDVAIEDRVEEWLENQNRFEDSGIFVSVSDGKVTLEVDVRFYALKQRAKLEVRNVPRVASVHNELQAAVETHGVKEVDKSYRRGNLTAMFPSCFVLFPEPHFSKKPGMNSRLFRIYVPFVLRAAKMAV
jgi:hypothetical protein